MVSRFVSFRLGLALTSLAPADHKSGFKSTSIVLARLFRLVESGDIQAPLYDPSTTAASGNPQYVAE